MITEDNVNKIYGAIVTDQELTTKFLNGLGFNSKDLAQLIDKGILKRIKRGYYDIVQIEPLYKYGIRTLTKEPKIAYKYLKKCYQMDPSYGNLRYNLIWLGINEKDYIQVLECLKLDNDKDKFTYTNHGFYLYLLSKLIDLPDKYKEIVNKLTLKDIQFLPNESNHDISKTKCRQKIRTLAFHNELPQAYKVRIEGTLTYCDRIIICLLKDIMQRRSQKYNVILQDIKDKNYTDAIEILKQMGNLCHHDKMILSLLYTLETIITEKIVPDKLDFKSDNVYEAIADENYEWALHLSDRFHEQNKLYQKDNDIIHLLLVNINEQIKMLENDCEESKDNEPKTINPDFVCPALVYLLMRNELEKFMQYLPEYLSAIKKEKYQVIIEYLLELDTINQDLVFTKTVNFINHLNDDTVLNISEYMQYTMDSIINRKLNQARIYLKIINSYSKLSEKIVPLEVLEPVLMQMLQLEEQSKKEKDMSEPLVEDSNILVESTEIGENCYKEELIEVVEDELPLIDSTTPQDKPTNDPFLQKKFNELEQNKGVIILKPMNEKKRNHLIELAKSYSDMVVFTIGVSEPKRLVLRYKPKKRDFVFINVKEECKEADRLYKEQKYDQALEKYITLLSVGYPNTYIYSKVGLSFLKLNNIKRAIEYLTVATEMSRENDGRYDFSELIAKLCKKEYVEEEEKKPIVRMSIEAFDNDINEYYGIDDIEGIANLVASGLDVIEACKQFNLTIEQIGIVLLIFARECYLQNNFTLGDYYLYKAERFDGKTPLIIRLLDSIRKNKKFYSNREQNDHKRLILLPEY